MSEARQEQGERDKKLNTETRETQVETGDKEKLSRTANDSESESRTDSTTDSNSNKSGYTPRFAGLTILLGFLTVTALVTISPVLLASTVVLLTVLIGGVIREPTGVKANLTTTHTIETANPRPGEKVTVHTSVKNTGSETLPDIRVVDTVPDELTVTDGSPRGGAVLRPGDEFGIEYRILARRGTYTFGTLTTRSRSLLGSQWIETEVEDADPVVMKCAVSADNIPLEEQAAHYIGGLVGDTGGEGVEFYSTREYHRGDTPSRINWRELAKGGDLTTVTFREHEAADVTLISDIRGPSCVTSEPGQPSTANLTMYATYQMVSALVNAGHYTGVTLPGIQPQEYDRRSTLESFPYARIRHGRGAEQRQQAFRLLTHVDERVANKEYTAREITPPRELGSGEFTGKTLTDTLFDVTPYQVQVTDFARKLDGWVHTDSQFIFVTPLLDNGAQQLCLQLTGLGFPVTVVSPTVPQPITDTHNRDNQAIPENTTHTQLQLMQRATRIESLRQHGLTVIDWETTDPLSTTVIQQTQPGEQ